jgi:hypothetical protein
VRDSAVRAEIAVAGHTRSGALQIPGSQERLIALCANAGGFALASEAIAHLACRTEGVALAFTALLRSAFAAI